MLSSILVSVSVVPLHVNGNWCCRRSLSWCRGFGNDKWMSRLPAGSKRVRHRWQWCGRRHPAFSSKKTRTRAPTRNPKWPVSSVKHQSPCSQFHILHIGSHIRRIIIATYWMILWSSSMRSLKLWPARSQRQGFSATHSCSSLFKSLLFWNLKFLSSCRV